MRLRVIAIGSRVPQWVERAFDDYASRPAAGLRLELTALEPGTRRGATPPERAVADEGRRMLAALKSGEHAVALEERGRELSTRELAAWLAERMSSGEDLAFLIGGPDGLAPEVLARCRMRWSLSRLTFPHALVRVILAEQLYRARTLLVNHPYHREG